MTAQFGVLAVGEALMALAQLPETAPEGVAGQLLETIDWATGLRALAMVVIGLPLVFFLSGFARKWATHRISAQVGLVSGRLIFYGGMVTLGITVVVELGFSLGPLLGAAGVVGIALGFASQTSVSNLIAGLFIIAEQPFIVDDVIEVGEVRGRVLSVDTMSVKLRTFDNRFVRIPNETLMKSTVVNITRFPIRRLDVRIGVARHEDPERVRMVLLDVANQNPIALMEPEPLVIFESFAESALELLFAVWTRRENWLELKNSIQEDLKSRFDEEGIEIPFPHRSLFVGAGSEAFPIRIITDADPSVEDVSSPEVGDDRTHQ